MSKKCPHCQGTKFKAIIKRAGAIELLADGSVNIIKELDKFSYEVVECLNPQCKKQVTNDELIDAVTCTQCGTVAKAEEITAEGLCPVCAALKERPELANASPQDLIKMLIAAERNNATTTGTKIEKKVEEADKAVENVQAKKVEADNKAATNTAQQNAAAASTENQPQQLTPQQKAAQTKKLNAEKKRLEEEALAKAATEAAAANTTNANAPAGNQKNPMDTGLPTGDDNNLLPTDDGFAFPQFGNDPF